MVELLSFQSRFARPPFSTWLRRADAAARASQSNRRESDLLGFFEFVSVLAAECADVATVSRIGRARIALVTQSADSGVHYSRHVYGSLLLNAKVANEKGAFDAAQEASSEALGQRGEQSYPSLVADQSWIDALLTEQCRAYVGDGKFAGFLLCKDISERADIGPNLRCTAIEAAARIALACHRPTELLRLEGDPLTPRSARFTLTLLRAGYELAVYHKQISRGILTDIFAAADAVTRLPDVFIDGMHSLYYFMRLLEISGLDRERSHLAQVLKREAVLRKDFPFSLTCRDPASFRNPVALPYWKALGASRPARIHRLRALIARFDRQLDGLAS